MVKVLQGLLGKTKCPLILNGKLYCIRNNPVLVSLSKYTLEFRTARDDELLDSDQQLEEMRSQLIATESYLLGRDIEWANIRYTADVDTFSGAIVIRSAAYSQMFNPENYELGIQHTPEVLEKLRKLMVDYISDYYAIFARLLSRRITAQHMPVQIRSHLVAGLFQPLVVSTKLIPSPMEFEWNRWYTDLFGDNNTYLERSADTTRKLNISCIAMCDVADTFDTPVIFELDRKAFMLMSMLLITTQIDEASGSALANTQQYTFRKLLYNPIEVARREGQLLSPADEEEAIHYNSAQFFTAALEYVRSMRTGISRRD